MTEVDVFSRLEELGISYVDQVVEDWEVRRDSWVVDYTELEKFEVLGGLLARQVTLATGMALQPGTWNPHFAPIILRTMIDTHITFSWIGSAPLERSRKFVAYGLGQDKLLLEHYKARASKRGQNPDELDYIQRMEEQINEQRFTFLTIVDVGIWSGESTRKLAEDEGLLDLYNFAYQPMSAGIHSMWNHIYRHNLQICQNPLHGVHRIPVVPSLDVDVDYFFRATKYLDMTFKRFDEVSEVDVKPSRARHKLEEAIDDLAVEMESIGSEPPPAGQ